MTRDEWLEQTLATAPPLSPAQLAILRPIFRPVIPADARPVLPRETEAAPARQQGPRMPAMTALREGSTTSDPS